LVIKNRNKKRIFKMSVKLTTCSDRETFCGLCRNFIPKGGEAVGHSSDGTETLVHLVHKACIERQGQQQKVSRCNMCAEEIVIKLEE
jgi:hypothetical protein